MKPYTTRRENRTRIEDLINTLDALVTEDALYYVHDIRSALINHLGEEPYWLTNSWIGCTMGRKMHLEGFKKRSRGYRLNRRIMRYIKRKYGVQSNFLVKET